MDEKYIANIINKTMSELPLRSREVLEKRFGLKKGGKRNTLESIGGDYGVTRERIRQIENSAKKLILETNSLISNMDTSIKELKNVISDFGGIVSEKDLLNHFTDKADMQDHLNFILNLSEPFRETKIPELHDRMWYTNDKSFDAFIKSLDKLYKDINTDELLTESEILSRFSTRLKEHTNNRNLLKNETVARLIRLSRKIGVNGLEQWGRADSRNISAKGIKDFAFLILNKVKEPMHFRDLTEEISLRFNKEVNVATCHNELIKDSRFILVGRGKYALKDWNQWSGGTVKEVIIEIIKKNKKAMTRDEIIDAVMKKKDVRKQTIVINLSDNLFARTRDGKYKLA